MNRTMRMGRPGIGLAVAIGAAAAAVSASGQAAPRQPPATAPVTADPSGPRELAVSERPKAPALDKLKCFECDHGWVYCQDAKQAGLVAQDVREAAAAFKQRFGADPGKGAVYIAGLEGDGAAMDQLRAAGARWVMPWIGAEGMLGGGQENAIKKQLVKQLKEQGLIQGGDGEDADKQAGEVLVKMGAGEGGYRALRHELGHIWFIPEFWGDGAAGLGEGGIDEILKHADEANRGKGGAIVMENVQHYGGPAADWLDETAAILMEDEDLTAHRRSQFNDRLIDKPETVRSLPQLFTMNHPVESPQFEQDDEFKAAIEKATKEAMEKALKGGIGGNGTMTTTSVVTIPMVKVAVTGEGMDQAGSFYEQCRSVADFLLERTKNPLLFREIAESEARKGPMADWLKANSERYGLPATVEGLDKAWREWAKAKAEAGLPGKP